MNRVLIVLSNRASQGKLLKQNHSQRVFCRKNLSSILHGHLAHIQGQARKKKNPLWKNFLHFSKEKNYFILRMKFSDPKIKKALIFSQKMFFIYFGKMNFLAPRLKNPRRELSELKQQQKQQKKQQKPTTTTTKHSEKFLCFRKWNFLASSFENSHFFLNKKEFLCIKSELQKPKKHFLYFLKKLVFFTLITYLKCF